MLSAYLINASFVPPTFRVPSPPCPTSMPQTLQNVLYLLTPGLSVSPIRDMAMLLSFGSNVPRTAIVAMDARMIV